MKRTVFCVIVWCFTVVALLVRFWQVGYVIDDFGFYAQSKETLCFGLDIALWGGIFLLGLSYRFLFKNTPTRPIKQSLLLGIGSLAVAFFCLPQAYMDCVTAETTNAMILAVLPSLITAVCFVLIAAFQIQGRKISYTLALLPVLSELTRVVVAYTKFNGLSRVTENAVYILSMLSFLLFCMSQFWLYYKGNQPKGIFGCYIFGATTGVFGLLSTLPHWVMGNNQLPLSYVGFGAAVYALIFMGVHAFAPRPASKQNAPAKDPTSVGFEEPQSTLNEEIQQ